MKEPARFSRGRVRYSGRIPRAAFSAWAMSPEGHDVLAALAREVRFSLFGRMRAAQHRVWRELARAARAQTAFNSIQHEIDEYLQRATMFAYTQELPRVGVDLRRLVVVPRLLPNHDAYQRMIAVLESDPAFGLISGGHCLREWFALTLVRSVEAAVAHARPSPRRPLPAGNDWIAVGVNESFRWRQPVDRAPWDGHYYLLEVRPVAITRAVRKATEQAIAALEASLPSLPIGQRYAILRQAR